MSEEGKITKVDRVARWLRDNIAPGRHSMREIMEAVDAALDNIGNGTIRAAVRAVAVKEGSKRNTMWIFS